MDNRKRVLWVSLVSSMITSLVVVMICFLAVYSALQNGLLEVYVVESPAQEFSISYKASMDWVLGKGPNGKFVRGITTSDNSVELEPDEDILFEVSLVLPQGLIRDQVDVKVVDYDGEESLMFVYRNCTKCKFDLKEWMKLLQKEGFNYPQYSR